MEDQTTGMAAPPVRAEACTELRVDDGSHWAICNVCGWLEDDHVLVDAGAVVTELPRRRALFPERMAS
jgi:hypothetical protein